MPKSQSQKEQTPKSDKSVVDQPITTNEKVENEAKVPSESPKEDDKSVQNIKSVQQASRGRGSKRKASMGRGRGSKRGSDSKRGGRCSKLSPATNRKPKKVSRLNQMKNEMATIESGTVADSKTDTDTNPEIKSPKTKPTKAP